MNKINGIFFAVSFLAFSLFSRAEEPKPVTNEDLLKELSKIQQRLDELEAKIKKIEENQNNNENPPDDLENNFPNQNETRGPDLKRLKEIKLPVNPTKEDVKKYVLDILNASKGQNIYSSQDIQVKMLSRVGSENVDVLIEDSLNPGNYYEYIGEAIKNLANDKNKNLIIENMPKQPQLISIVIFRGWGLDARDMVMKTLQDNDLENLSWEFAQALAEYKDPNTYDLIKNFILENQFRAEAISYFKDIPDLDLNETVSKAWDKIRNRGGWGNGDWEKCNFAPIAAEYGFISGLDALAQVLASEKNNENQYFKNQAKQAFSNLTDFWGSDKVILDLYKKNRESLVFDPVLKKYVIDEKKAAEKKETQNKPASEKPDSNAVRTPGKDDF